MHILLASAIEEDVEMTASDFRHAHLLEAIEQYGTIERLAKAVGLSAQYLSQLKNGTRGIGHKTARKLEAALGWPDGAMDRPPSGGALDSELAYLLKNMPEDSAVNVIAEALPDMSERGVRALTAALLGRLSDSKQPEE